MVDSIQTPGMQVGSNVRLTHLLGEGGMGSIWVAEHLSLQTQVAVKLLHQHVAELPEVRTRFQREAAAAAQLRSPHVVQIFDYGVTQHGVPFIVMELLEGEDLGRHIERLGPRSVSVVVEIVFQVARALAVAHARGVVHRDIKPENVFLTDTEGEVFVKLLDFGIAKRSEDAAMNVTNTNFMLGTPNFMSPEQLMNPKDVDFKTDLWSVAVVAYVALTGKLPFYGESIGALCVAVNAGDFAPVTRLRPELPFSLDAWFERAFKRDPQSRFASAQEMATAFEQAAGITEPRRWSSADLIGADSARKRLSTPPPRVSSAPPAPFSSTPPPELGDLSRHSSSFNASVTHTAPRKSQIGTLLLVVFTSMVASAITTVLVMAPSSLGRLLDAIAGGGAAESATPANFSDGVTGNEWPEQLTPAAAASAQAPPSPEVVPSEPEAASDDSVRLRANKPEASATDITSSSPPPTASTKQRTAPKRKPKPRRPPKPAKKPPPIDEADYGL